MLQAQQAKPSVKLYDWTDTSGRTIKAAFMETTQKSKATLKLWQADNPALVDV